MKEWWAGTAARIDAMSLRDRVLVFAAMAAGLIALVNLLLLDPLQASRVSAQEGIATDEKGLAEVHARMALLGIRAGDDPDQANRARLEALRGQRAELEEKMQAVRAKLVPADQMIGLLRNLLHQDGRLELVSLRTLAVVPVALRRDREKPNDLPLEGTQALYRHAVELKLRGRYAAIHDYLARLENIGRRLYWDEMKLAAKYPVSTLTLTLHTLSLEEAWLSL